MQALFLRGEGVIFGGEDGRAIRLSGQNIDFEWKKKYGTGTYHFTKVIRKYVLSDRCGSRSVVSL
jgi:hypothetical protein